MGRRPRPSRLAETHKDVKTTVVETFVCTDHRRFQVVPSARSRSCWITQRGRGAAARRFGHKGTGIRVQWTGDSDHRPAGHVSCPVSNATFRLMGGIRHPNGSTIVAGSLYSLRRISTSLSRHASREADCRIFWPSAEYRFRKARAEGKRRPFVTW